MPTYEQIGQKNIEKARIFISNYQKLWEIPENDVSVESDAETPEILRDLSKYKSDIADNVKNFLNKHYKLSPSLRTVIDGKMESIIEQLMSTKPIIKMLSYIDSNPFWKNLFEDFVSEGVISQLMKEKVIINVKESENE